MSTAHPTLLDDLGRMVSEFEALPEAPRTGRRDHIGARAELDVIVSELVHQVRVLDSVNRHRYGKDPKLDDGVARGPGGAGAAPAAGPFAALGRW
jgi:hypothetical protein